MLKNPTPDIILYNGNIITVDETIPSAEAVLLSGERIVFVGSGDKVFSYASEDTIKIDLKGKTVVPGFNDNHIHTFAAGRFLDFPCLWGKTSEEIEEVVKKEAAKKKPGAFIFGNSWDYPTCPNPHKDILDKAAPNNPVLLMQYSGHASWVNTRMLEKMKINRNTPDPKGGQIVRDDNGDPTGILRDTAVGKSGIFHHVKAMVIPSVHKKTLETALKHFREAGITSVQDNSWMPLTVRYLNTLKKQGKLTCRFTCWALGDFKAVRHSMKLASYDDLWVRKGLIKYFADGAFSTRTAYLLSQPYADEPDNFGKPRYSKSEIDNFIFQAARDRHQIAIHAIGDGATHQVLDAIGKAKIKYPDIDALRFRLEHVQLADKKEIERMKELDVLACLQPFSLSTPEKDITLLGEERAKKAYPFLTMFRSGIPVSFGSDAPAEVDFNPLLGIYYAVTRKDKTGTSGPLNKNECFSPYEALYCYTMGSAYAEFMENEKGSITKGKLTDLVVLSDDLTHIEKEKIKDIKVLMTIVGGKIVYSV